MDRLFLDANILFSAAYRADAGLLRFWQLKDVVLFSSHYALEEARFNLAEKVQKVRLSKLAKKLQFADAIPGVSLQATSLPEKDLPILIAAIAARATHLITGDVRHFGQYFGKRIAGVLVLPPAQYLQKYRKS